MTNDLPAYHPMEARSPEQERHRTHSAPPRAAVRPLQLAPSRYVTIDLFATITGLTPGAIRKRIERGVYVEGKQYRRAPDGRLWMDTKGHEQWVEAETA